MIDFHEDSQRDKRYRNDDLCHHYLNARAKNSLCESQHCSDSEESPPGTEVTTFSYQFRCRGRRHCNSPQSKFNPNGSAVSPKITRLRRAMFHVNPVLTATRVDLFVIASGIAIPATLEPSSRRQDDL